MKIDAGMIPDHEQDRICRTILQDVTALFERPEVQEDYERWLSSLSKDTIEALHLDI